MFNALYKGYFSLTHKIRQTSCLGWGWGGGRGGELVGGVFGFCHRINPKPMSNQFIFSVKIGARHPTHILYMPPIFLHSW